MTQLQTSLDTVSQSQAVVMDEKDIRDAQALLDSLCWDDSSYAEERVAFDYTLDDSSDEEEPQTAQPSPNLETDALADSLLEESPFLSANDNRGVDLSYDFATVDQVLPAQHDPFNTVADGRCNTTDDCFADSVNSISEQEDQSEAISRQFAEDDAPERDRGSRNRVHCRVIDTTALVHPESIGTNRIRENGKNKAIVIADTGRLGNLNQVMWGISLDAFNKWNASLVPDTESPPVSLSHEE